MPTVLRVSPYSFVFFSSDRGEPVHIHVKHDRRVAKFWLDPVELAKNLASPIMKSTRSRGRSGNIGSF